MDREVLIPPPILLATRTLGWKDAQLARILGVAQPRVAIWASSGCVPPLRHAALLIFVTAALDDLRPQIQPDTYHGQKIAIMVRAAQSYSDLAEHSLAKQHGGDEIPPDLIARAMPLAQQMMDRLPQVVGIIMEPRAGHA